MENRQIVGPIAAVAEALANRFVVMIIVSIVAILFRSFTSACSHHTIGGQVCVFQKFDCKKTQDNRRLVSVFCIRFNTHIYRLFSYKMVWNRRSRHRMVYEIH